jgi:hypothetical protein
MNLNTRKWAAVGVSVLLVVGVEYGLLRFLGVFDWLIYNMLFWAGLAGVPALIYLGSPSFPGFLRSALGRGHVILGAAALGDWWLVQRDHGWEIAPGDEDQAYIDGEWRPVKGMEHRSRLGWFPFGILRYKDASSNLKQQTVDPDAVADGGLEKRADGKVTIEAKRGLDRDGWAINLLTYFSDGLRRAADLSLISKAEEIAKREAADGPVGSGYETAISGIVGLLLGVGTAYALLYL